MREWFLRVLRCLGYNFEEEGRIEVSFTDGEYVVENAQYPQYTNPQGVSLQNHEVLIDNTEARNVNTNENTVPCCVRAMITYNILAVRFF
jgi:hypothetical protein